MTGGRPPRPALEAWLVREAAATMHANGPREATARKIACKVVEELRAYLGEGDDPLFSAFGDLKRRAAPSPFATLAVDPSIDTVSDYVEEAVAALRSRCGRRLSPSAAAAEEEAILRKTERLLTSRYVRHLRIST